MSDTPCYHCGLPVPAGVRLDVEIDGARRPVCCGGCQAVAQAIVAGGLADYYRLRSAPPGALRDPVPEALRRTAVYDNPRVQASFVRPAGADLREAALMLEGITCAACVWLNERHLAALPGVVEVEVNYTTHRARVLWEPARIRLSEILDAVGRIGYVAHPYDPARQERLLETERRGQLRRLGVAGLLGMQVMMIAVALYAGDWYGMEPRFRSLFHWVSLLLTVPVLAYSGRPFFAGAWRDLRAGHAGMDVPVALGLSLAFAGSVHATVTGAGAVYYDSVVMFVFLLLGARYVELVARRRGAELGESLAHAAPAFATRLAPAGGEETVAVAELLPGDRVRVRPGEAVPADGRVLAGASSVDEAVLTGESRPVAKSAGDSVIGGAINVEGPLEVEVERTGDDTVLSQIHRLVERAQAHKPRIARLADRAAAVFVGAVLVLAAGVAAWWWHAAPQSWLPITVAVLVVTCPCALSLATPTAMAAGTGALARRGLVITRGHALESLARVTHVVLDKTGTLTEGRLAVAGVRVLGALEASECLALAAALERHSEHPVARAVLAAAAEAGVASLDAREVRNRPGGGITGVVGARRCVLGTPEFLAAAGVSAAGDPHPEVDPAARVLLGVDGAPAAEFTLADRVRPDAAAAVAALRALGVTVSLLSGDRPGTVAAVARAVGVEAAQGGLLPEAKLERVHALQAAGAVVAMVGDGVNDAPVLAAAEVSVAMGGGAQLARASADMVLVSETLAALPEGLRSARRTLAVVRQNLLWAAGYNAVALPAAAAGYVAPWMAAVGMSLSSLAVVLNALRLSARPRPDPD